ncbi:uncharacterized protein LOC134235752 [Saccostrea cucullata]|uniref:uncharacterized protein LOC134235752 n=1 Tax=Saccostrea cuccullata TaxID=36930 RepID=UPI002ED0A5B5
MSELGDHFVPDYEEEPLPNHVQGSTLGKKGKKCPVCNSKFTHVRRHVIQEHIPWFLYPKTSCWTCELGFGQERFLRLHIEKEHFDDSTYCRYDINIHGHIWVEKISTLINRFNKVNVISFINSNEKFSACLGTIWQEDDLVQIKYYLETTHQHQSLPKSPYPAQNFTSLFHWKILSILLDISSPPAEVLQNCELTKEKDILIIGSSIIHWAHQRSIDTYSTDLGLQNCNIKWHGIRGMRWSSLTETLHSATKDIIPNIIIIHLGSNNISFSSPFSLITKMKNDISSYMENFPDTIFIYSELLSRRVWGKIAVWEGENKKMIINRELGSFMERRGGKVIFHHEIHWKNRTLFRRDGVHLTEIGNDILLSDFKDALRMLC